MNMATIGLSVRGKIGSQTGSACCEERHKVVIANSPSTRHCALIAELGTELRAPRPPESPMLSFRLVTVPLKNYLAIPVEPLAERSLIDTNNYYPQRDWPHAELDNESTTTAELLQAHLPTSKVVKAFNHITLPISPPTTASCQQEPAAPWSSRETIRRPRPRSAGSSINLASTVVDAGPLKEGCASSAIRLATARGAMQELRRIWRRPSATRIGKNHQRRTMKARRRSSHRRRPLTDRVKHAPDVQKVSPSTATKSRPAGMNDRVLDRTGPPASSSTVR